MLRSQKTTEFALPLKSEHTVCVKYLSGYALEIACVEKLSPPSHGMQSMITVTEVMSEGPHLVTMKKSDERPFCPGDTEETIISDRILLHDKDPGNTSHDWSLNGTHDEMSFNYDPEFYEVRTVLAETDTLLADLRKTLAEIEESQKSESSLDQTGDVKIQYAASTSEPILDPEIAEDADLTAAEVEAITKALAEAQISSPRSNNKIVETLAEVAVMGREGNLTTKMPPLVELAMRTHMPEPFEVAHASVRCPSIGALPVLLTFAVLSFLLALITFQKRWNFWKPTQQLQKPLMPTICKSFQ
eukprot:gnl/MRDRNA2_/MRDRNA2_20208_c0_seq1.p1 gnl/MRDRNA2_/MRDRNA2_20208_c0~~gnl/MRDRNA2_/MRDRNA2_20208_c0_seq1.p1  ORF type:complete len:332 (+),score=51.88 gnl/MRDRNA2_/MRDRNA2_20208_c0_seq1:92-997(+)